MIMQILSIGNSENGSNIEMVKVWVHIYAAVIK